MTLLAVLFLLWVFREPIRKNLRALFLWILKED